MGNWVFRRPWKSWRRGKPKSTFVLPPAPPPVVIPDIIAIKRRSVIAFKGSKNFTFRRPWWNWGGAQYRGAMIRGASPGLFVYVPSGGLQSGGADAVCKGKAPSAIGGLQSGGAGTLAKGKALTPAGGLQTGGTDLRSKTKVYAVSGGLQTGGAGTTLKGKTYAPSGGLQSGGGAALLNKIKNYPPSGGGVFAGNSGTTKGKVYVPAGGATLGGTDAVAKGKAFTPSGLATLQTGGVATTLKLVVFAYTPTGRAVDGQSVIAGARRKGISFKTAKRWIFRRPWWSWGGAQTRSALISNTERVYGLTFGGTAASLKIKVYPPSGGVVFGGTGLPDKIKNYVGSGGMVFAGDGVTFITNNPEAALIIKPLSSSKLITTPIASNTNITGDATITGRTRIT